MKQKKKKKRRHGSLSTEEIGTITASVALFALILLVLVTLLAMPLRENERQDALVTMPTAHPAEPSTELSTKPPTEPLTQAPTAPPTEPPTQPPTEYRVPQLREDVPGTCILEDVPLYSQEGIAPTGCELVSAMMVLEYYGAPYELEEIVDAVPCVWPEVIDGYVYAPHPERAFIGSPWTESSYGCYAPVVTDMLNKLLPEDCVAYETTGTELATLASVYIPQGKPVLVWETISMLEHFDWGGWYLLDEDGNPTDEWYDWQANEHCMVLVGYDESSYYFNDPYGSHGFIAYDKWLAEERFNSMGQYSIVVEQIPDA